MLVVEIVVLYGYAVKPKTKVEDLWIAITCQYEYYLKRNNLNVKSSYFVYVSPKIYGLSSFSVTFK